MFEGSRGDNGPSGKGAPEARRRTPTVLEVKLDKLFEKPPPHSPEAEMALLGAMILDPRVTGDVIMIVKSPAAFFHEAHGAIFQALVELYDKHQAGDLVQLLDSLRDKDVLKDVGGTKYLEKLARETPGAAGAPHWARIVADKARLRVLITTAGAIVYNAFTLGQGDSQSASEIIDQAEQQIFEIARTQELFEPQSMAELVQAEYDRIESLQGKGVSGLRTEYHELDRMLSGFQPGEMIIIAARPSMGKTALALNLAEQVSMGGLGTHAGRAKVPVGFFSLEMSKSAIAQRLLSARSGISAHDMRSGNVRTEDLRKLLDAAGELHDAPMFIDDMPALTVMALRARARRMVQQYAVKCIFVDYLQLMTAPAFARESRQVEVAAISRGIKALARELEMPIICLSQLNRGPESRSDNRPRMSDLRESGSIEQDADVVMLLHREEYYHVGDTGWLNDPDNTDKIGVAELIIAKQRNGPTGVVELKWDAETTRFKNLAHRGSGYAHDSSGGGYGAPTQHQAPRAQHPPSPFPTSHIPHPTSETEPPPFAPGKKSGPEAGFRDGGGPDRDDLLPPPEEADDDVGGLPI
jgi:replicative DNA helicase